MPNKGPNRRKHDHSDPLPVDLDELAGIFEGDPIYGGGLCLRDPPPASDAHPRSSRSATVARSAKLRLLPAEDAQAVVLIEVLIVLEVQGGERDAMGEAAQIS